LLVDRLTKPPVGVREFRAPAGTILLLAAARGVIVAGI
jgi:hypothetical protein